MYRGMKRNSDNLDLGPLTKTQEKVALAVAIRQLPEGYARAILTDLLPDAERAIDSDVVWIPFRARAEEVESHRQLMLEEYKKQGVLQQKTRELEGLLRGLRGQLADVREQIRRLARASEAGL